MRRAFIGISRHRLLRDGSGITTLAVFHGCTLNCKCCLNPGSSNAKRPYGKDVCAVLKAIRQLIADKNEVPFGPHLCTHEGACTGSCSACEKEVKFIEKALEARRKNGETVII